MKYFQKVHLQDKKECYFCKKTDGLHLHECLFGTANRKKSIKWGLQVYLCGPHHNLSSEGVHFDHEKDMELKRLAQTKFEEEYSHDLWMKEFKKNYL